VAYRAEPQVRARDIDRSTTIAVLDNSRADGQLDFGEHQSRVERARNAVTLAQLDALVTDLQTAPGTVAPPVAAPRGPQFPWLLAVLVVLGIALAAWLVLSGKPPKADSAPAATTSTAPTTLLPTEAVPIVAPKVNLATADGLRTFTELYRAKFGDTLADEWLFYPEGPYAIVTRAEQANRARDYTFRGGFEPGTLDKRDSNVEAIDFATVNIDALAELMASAPQRLGVPDAKVSHVSFRTDRSGSAVNVYADNKVHEGGYIAMSPAGEVLRIQKSG
jgi:hypothetical protein